MIEALTSGGAGEHFLTGERRLQYVAVLRCGCRRRFERFTAPVDAVRVKLTCPFCGDDDDVRLRDAASEKKRERDRSRGCHQTIRCGHPDCEATFDVEYSADDPDRIQAVCPECGTLKALRRETEAPSRS